MKKNSSPVAVRFSLLFIGILVIFTSLSGQQPHVYNQFFMNPYIYNPAYAGVDGHSVLFGMYKQQWLNIAEGPKLSHITFHTPLPGGIGLGVAAFNDEQGPLTSSVGKISSSYLINIDRKHFLRFGMSLGGGTNSLMIPEDVIGDEAFQGQAGSYLVGDFGATYHFGHFNLGFSIPHLFKSPIITANGDFVTPDFKPTDHMIFKMNYRGHISGQIAIEPHILYRYSTVVPSQYEATTIIHLAHIAWLGGTYRQDAGIVGLLGFKVKNKFAVGAAFELGNPDYNLLTGPSFEVHLGFHMGSHHKNDGDHVKDHHKDSHHNTFFVTSSEDHLERDSLRKARKRLNSSLTKQTNNPKKIDTNGSTLKEWEINPEVITNAMPSGEVEIFRTIKHNMSDTKSEVVVAKTPPNEGGKSWGMAGIQNYEERTSADGKEVAINWVRLRC